MYNKDMLYILVGLPYAGKTTLTKELVNRFGFMRVSMDDVIDEKGFNVVDMTQEDWNLVYSEGYEKLKSLLVEGKTVILDLGNLKKSERDTARRIANEAHVDATMIYLDVPVETIKKRWETNAQTQERGQLEEVTLQSAIGMFQAPEPDEKYIIYNQTLDLDTWIKENNVGIEGSPIDGRRV
jgi:predicted kinase